MPSLKFDITLPLVQKLINAQFPQYAHLPITPVPLSGWDNKTFRLGDHLLVRLPSAQGYVAQVEKEQQWLPQLAAQLPCPIPTPVAMGAPMPNEYPWPWSIYKWIDGESANALAPSQLNLSALATQLAAFLKALHAADTTNAPPAGAHNYYRGAHLSVYSSQTHECIAQMASQINVERATQIWEKALASSWMAAAVWLHGDFAAGNILVKNKQLAAVIDFGCMAVGDPACDLTIAYTFLDALSRPFFKQALGLDENTWQRARGWALWKALNDYCEANDKNSPKALAQLQVLDVVLSEI